MPIGRFTARAPARQCGHPGDPVVRTAVAVIVLERERLHGGLHSYEHPNRMRPGAQARASPEGIDLRAYY